MTGGKNRYYSFKKAKRAKRIDMARGSIFVEHPWYNNLHQYSKNKIFCDCYWCRCKTRQKGKRDYWRISDRRKFDRLNYEESEVEDNGN